MWFIKATAWLASSLPVLSNTLTGVTQQWDEIQTEQFHRWTQFFNLANVEKKLTRNVSAWIQTHIQQTKLSFITSVQLPSFYFLFMNSKTVKCTSSHWMKRRTLEIHLVYKPALEYSLQSPRPPAEHLVDSLHFSSSPAPRSRLCSLVGWASPPRSPSDGCCSWTLLFLRQGRCPVSIGCRSSQCPGKTYSNHWKMALCREKVL